MMSSLEDAKRTGAKMIAINPLPEAGLLNFANPNPQHYSNILRFPLAVIGNKATHLADLHLPVRIGGDMAVLKGIMKAMLDRERAAPGTDFDPEYITAHLQSYDGLMYALDDIN